MWEPLHSILPQGAERVMIASGGVLGGALSFAFGDVGPLMIWLTVFIVADFVTGTWAAVSRGEWTSKRNALGIAKKIVMLGMVALAHGLDKTFEPLIGACIFQSITICAYACGEFGSIIENLEKGGLGGAVPPVLRRLVQTLNERIESHAISRLEEKGLKYDDTRTEKQEPGKPHPNDDGVERRDSSGQR